MTSPSISHRFADVNGLRLFYREAGPRDAPALLLLHGFPSASHQYARLIDALGDRYRLIAPDLPGFGHSDAPAPSSKGGAFRYTFDHLSEVLEAFCAAIGLTRFVLYAFDYGGPWGLRLALRHPEWIAGLVLQSANAYAEGLSPLAEGLVAERPGIPGADERLLNVLTPEVTRQQHLGGARHPEQIAPEGWLLDQHFLELPGRKDIQVELALDYHSNVERYPQWQAWLRREQPPTLVLWGQNDAFFLEAGARAVLRDVPGAELHLFDTGHFALEEALPQVAPILASFVDRAWAR